MRTLWSEERVDLEGEYYRTVRATIYDRPDKEIPLINQCCRAHEYQEGQGVHDESVPLWATPPRRSWSLPRSAALI